MISERDALADRQWLSPIEGDVLAQIERTRRIAALRVAAQSVSTTKITAKSTEFAQALVSDVLRAEAAREARSP
jgi:hypothetical protein